MPIATFWHRPDYGGQAMVMGSQFPGDNGPGTELCSGFVRCQQFLGKDKFPGYTCNPK